MNLDHTIVPSKDKVAAAKWFARVFGRSYDGADGHFAPVMVDDALTLDFDDAESFESHHYAFLVSEEEFDDIFGRVKEEGISYGAEPYEHQNMQINHRLGGRGVYFADPDGHLLELMTRK